ncbi:MAG: hypothetical protein R3339_11460 [Thermodesulfobacteriota bacterium]|nr:hypothetical protein [Thermodesulfobacteriota bacterium]
MNEGNPQKVVAEVYRPLGEVEMSYLLLIEGSISIYQGVWGNEGKECKREEENPSAEKQDFLRCK